jgi:hypothetical protein
MRGGWCPLQNKNPIWGGFERRLESRSWSTASELEARPNSGPKRKERAIVTLGAATGTARRPPIEGGRLAYQGRNSRQYQIALSWQEPGLCERANCARETAVGICCGRGTSRCDMAIKPAALY